MSGPELRPTAPTECRECGAELVLESVRSTFSQGGHLVAVDGVPSYVCPRCGERHFDLLTRMALALVRGDGFESDGSAAGAEVPAYRFGAPPTLP